MIRMLGLALQHVQGLGVVPRREHQLDEVLGEAIGQARVDLAVEQR